MGVLAPIVLASALSLSALAGPDRPDVDLTLAIEDLGSSQVDGVEIGRATFTVTNLGPNPTGTEPLFPWLGPLINVWSDGLVIDSQGEVPAEFFFGAEDTCLFSFDIPDPPIGEPFQVYFLVFWEESFAVGQSRSCTISYAINPRQSSTVRVSWEAFSIGDEELNIDDNRDRILLSNPIAVPTQSPLALTFLCVLLLLTGRFFARSYNAY